jgi:Tfp pilus assembly protein PilO
MATSGALADFGRLPTNRKVLIFVAIAGFLGFFYHRFVYKDLAKSAKSAEAAFNQAKQKNAQMEQDLKDFTELRRKKTKLDEEFIAMRRALPTAADVPAFFEMIERKLTDAGIDDMKFVTKPEQVFDQYVKVPLEVEMRGTFMQIKRFFASLVDKKKVADSKDIERIVSIEDLSLTQPEIRNRELVLTAKFIAFTFRQATAAPVQSAPGQLPADAPAPSSVGGPNATPPPLPSADTPAGAKANIDDSLKKAEQRLDEATKDPGATGSARLKGGL